jgi:hypothetical protein
MIDLFSKKLTLLFSLALLCSCALTLKSPKTDALYTKAPSYKLRKTQESGLSPIIKYSDFETLQRNVYKRVKSDFHYIMTGKENLKKEEADNIVSKLPKGGIIHFSGRDESIKNSYTKSHIENIKVFGISEIQIRILERQEKHGSYEESKWTNWDQDVEILETLPDTFMITSDYFFETSSFGKGVYKTQHIGYKYEKNAN